MRLNHFLLCCAGAVGLSSCGTPPQPAANPVVIDSAPINAEQWPALTAPIAIDPQLEQRIDDLLAQMSDAEKVGQLIQADINSVTPADVRRYHLGSVLNGGNSAPGEQPYAAADAWLAAADEYYAAAMDDSDGHVAIPLLWGSDAVHGHNNVIGATLFPHNIGLGAARNPELIQRIGEITATEVAVTGLDWTFAPTLAVVQDERWGRTYEGYSADPAVVAAYASAMVEGLQGPLNSAAFLNRGKVIATAKHFLGDGGTVDGKDQGDNRSSETELREIHGAGYPPALLAGAQTVMASFSSWRGDKLHGHAGLLTGVLKQRWQFDGFVVGDWNGHGQVTGCTNTHCPRAINAGLDMFMAPDSWRELYTNTLDDVTNGAIPRPRLDDAVRRILRVKLRAGLFEAGPPSSRPLAGRFDLLAAPQHRAVARDAARQSLVLLKNQQQLLPLANHLRLAVTGDGADNISKQAGGWTLSWQGKGHSNSDFPQAESILDGIRAAVEPHGGQVMALAADELTDLKADQVDAAIVVFGEDPYAEFQGDIPHLGFSLLQPEPLTQLTTLREKGIPTVAIFLSGRPLWLNPEINQSDAFVAAWLPGSEGGGVADLLFEQAADGAAYEFRGQLPFPWPNSAMPSSNDQPLWPLGYGLSKTDDGNIAALNEDPGAIAVDQQYPDTFLDQGKITEGLNVVTSGDSLRVDRIDRHAQEDSIRLRWSGNGEANWRLESDQAYDASKLANGDIGLAISLQVQQAPAGPLLIGMGCGESNCSGSIDLSTLPQLQQLNQWQVLRIPLKCFARAGADLTQVQELITISSATAATIAIDRIALDDSAEFDWRCD
ncbi:MAG: exo 1,3/1,4-beta-D-glucan glucohydrolase [Wenzhouxiangellaceae bacterium]